MKIFVWYRGRHVNWDIGFGSPWFQSFKPRGQDAWSRTLALPFIKLIVERPYP